MGNLRGTWEEIDKGNLLRIILLLTVLILVIVGAYVISSQTGSAPPSNQTVPDYHMSPV